MAKQSLLFPSDRAGVLCSLAKPSGNYAMVRIPEPIDLDKVSPPDIQLDDVRAQRFCLRPFEKCVGTRALGRAVCTIMRHVWRNH